MNDFLTIQNATDGLYKEKGSKFIAFAFPLRSEEEIGKYLEELKTKYHDARHHCYAWVYGLSEQKWRANDDGEPSHSAGDPILGQIRSFSLTNVLVVVVRYFGGTKLGVGGLINAYKTSARAALEQADTRILVEKSALTLEFGYDDIRAVEKLISDYKLEAQRTYHEKCHVEALIKKSDVDAFLQATSDLYNIKIEIVP